MRLHGTIFENHEIFLYLFMVAQEGLIICNAFQ